MLKFLNWQTYDSEVQKKSGLENVINTLYIIYMGVGETHYIYRGGGTHYIYMGGGLK